MKKLPAVLRSLALAALVATPAVGGAQLSNQPPVGFGITWLGGDLIITGISKLAADASHLYLMQADSTLPVTGTNGDLTGTTGNARFVGDNYVSITNASGIYADLTWQRIFTEAQLMALGFSLGNELVFANYNITSNIWNFTGPESRNRPTDYFGGSVTCSDAFNCVVAMEDRNPFNEDYNDMVFSVTATPEPGTIGLLATGLLGIAGVAARRRRKNS